jgi:hypothetical protein
MDNKPIILKDTYEVSASKVAYTKPLFDENGDWVINMVITKEEWDNERTDKMRCKIKNDDLKALFYCLKKEGVIEEHEKCEKQCSYCKMEKSLGQ